MRKPEPPTGVPIKVSRKRRRLGLGLVLLVIAAAAIFAASGGASDGSPASSATLAASPPGPGHLLRIDGINADSATPVFTLDNGQQLSVASNGETRCLLRAFDGRPAGEACADTEGIAAGRAITVSDECAAAGHQRMEITGLAPEGTTTIRLDYTDQHQESTDATDGAFRFEGTNPVSGQPYPTAVEWVTNGASEGSAPLPVKGDEFCLPAQEPN